MNIYLQYAFIALTLLLAVRYLIKLFRETFFSRKKKCGGSVDCKCGRD